MEERGRGGILPDQSKYGCYGPVLFQFLNLVGYSLPFLAFLGRLPKVDLIILEGKKCPSVRPSVRPQKVSSISMKFGI